MKRIFAHFLRRLADRLDPVDWAEIERHAERAFEISMSHWKEAYPELWRAENE